MWLVEWAKPTPPATFYLCTLFLARLYIQNHVQINQAQQATSSKLTQNYHKIAQFWKLLPENRVA